MFLLRLLIVVSYNCLLDPGSKLPAGPDHVLYKYNPIVVKSYLPYVNVGATSLIHDTIPIDKYDRIVCSQLHIQLHIKYIKVMWILFMTAGMTMLTTM